MQPRSCLDPLLVTVFHVTKRGWASSVGRLLVLEFLLIELLASLIPLGVELALCTLDELVVAGDGAKSRDIAAGL
jgi:hypothetical protein